MWRRIGITIAALLLLAAGYWLLGTFWPPRVVLTGGADPVVMAEIQAAERGFRTGSAPLFACSLTVTASDETGVTYRVEYFPFGSAVHTIRREADGSWTVQKEQAPVSESG